MNREDIRFKGLIDGIIIYGILTIFFEHYHDWVNSDILYEIIFNVGMLALVVVLVMFIYAYWYHKKRMESPFERLFEDDYRPKEKAEE